jgi:hypothetical protein
VVPFQILLAMLLGWLECEQRDVITFLREENRALKAQLAGRRLRLTDAQRCRLAMLGHSDAPCCATLRRSSRPTQFSDGIAN